jgi:hypothetical protein
LTSGEATATHGTILWTTSNGLGTISDETTLTPTYHAVAGDEGHAVVLTLTVTSDNSCGTATATAPIQLNVDALPTATAGGSATICSNSTYTLTSGEPLQHMAPSCGQQAMA